MKVCPYLTITDILSIDFIRVAGTDPKPDARFVLTDGCGFMNGSAMSYLARRFNSPFRPAAVQGRIAGSKGLWILHPTDRSPNEPRRIWIRDSQRKVLHLPFDQIHRSHRIFNLVAVARVSSPHKLTKQALINLEHGGVPDEVFMELMRQALTDETNSLIDWDAPAPVLWDTIYQAGGVRSSRLQIQTRGFGRVLGVAGRKFRENISADDTDIDDTESDTEDTIGQQSKEPFNSLYENALQLVQSGFHPQHCKILNRKLKTILDLVMQSCIKEYRFTLPVSAEAFLAPGA
jgi:RNA-dependent RNA polymerase